MTETTFLLFLIWNLVLAFIPWCISVLLYLFPNMHKCNAVVLLVVWLLFFPNAPYILTDIVHLKKSVSQYMWFDFVLLLAYGFTGLFYAYTSLGFIEKMFKRLFKVRYSRILSCIALYLSAYGIYLGRFLRWNSWDILVNLPLLCSDIISHVRHPLVYMHVWIFSGLMGTVLLLFYHAFKSFNTVSVVNNSVPESAESGQL